MKINRFHKDHELLASYTQEACNNLLSTLTTILQKIQNTSPLTENAHLYSCHSILEMVHKLLPEQKASLQKMLLQAFPAIRIILDSQNANVIVGHRTNKEIQVSYTYSNIIFVLEVFCYALDCLKENLELKNRTVCHYLRIILGSSLVTIRSMYKYNSYNKDEKSLLPENGLVFLKNGIYTKNKDKHLTINKDWFFYPGDERISYVGKIELISLFLSPERILGLLSEINLMNHFSNTARRPSLTQQQIVFRFLSCYSIRIRRKPLEIQKGKLENALEIFQTLRKCPEELYPILPCEKQAEFNLSDISNRCIVMKRNNDITPYLLIQYFDKNNCFKDIKFGFHIGFISRRYPEYHRYADGEKRERFVKDNITCFTSSNKISDFVELFNSTNRESGFHRDKIYYIRNGENFAISFGEKLPVYNNGKYTCPEPDCWISKYELEAMAFYEFLCPGMAEEVIKDAYKKVCFTAIHNNSSPKTDSINKQVSILLKETDSMIVDLEKKEEVIKHGNANVGKRSFVRIKANELAAFIIKDIIFWMEKDKPSGLQYAVVKGMLTNFDGKSYNYYAIRQALRNLPISLDRHPVLKRIKSAENILDFYRKYLESKRDFLSELLSGNCIHPILLRKGEKNISENKHQHPFYIARHTFRGPILYELRNRIPTMEKTIGNSAKCSLNSLVISYLENIENDRSQNMYTLFRRDQYGYYRLLTNNHKTLERWNMFPVGKDKEIVNSMITASRMFKHQTLTNKKEFEQELCLTKKKMYDSEKKIRRHRANDIILFLLARRCLESYSNKFKEIKLYHFDPLGKKLPEEEITQNITLLIDSKIITVIYKSSLMNSGLLYRWINNPLLQQDIINRSRNSNEVIITSDDIQKMFRCKIRE